MHNGPPPVWALRKSRQPLLDREGHCRDRWFVVDSLGRLSAAPRESARTLYFPRMQGVLGVGPWSFFWSLSIEAILSWRLKEDLGTDPQNCGSLSSSLGDTVFKMILLL